MTVLVEPFASVYDDRNRLGVILARGKRGFEAYAADDHSLGLFSSTRKAAAAITMTRPWVGQKTAENKPDHGHTIAGMSYGVYSSGPGLTPPGQKAGFSSGREAGRPARNTGPPEGVALAAPTPFDIRGRNPATTLAQWRGFPLGTELSVIFYFSGANLGQLGPPEPLPPVGFELCFCGIQPSVGARPLVSIPGGLARMPNTDHTQRWPSPRSIGQYLRRERGPFIASAHED
jgi:hypothetical protein